MKLEQNLAAQNRPLSVRTQLRIAFLIVFVVRLFNAFLIKGTIYQAASLMHKGCTNLAKLE